MRILQSFILVLTVLTVMSCGPKLRYFSEDMYRQYEWSENELKRIQFYVSQDIVLYRSLADRNSTIDRGKIKVSSNREVEEVVIKKGTPGVFLKEPRTNKFAITFDRDGERYLMFGPNSRTSGRFVLLAKEWDRNSGEITYGGEMFYTSAESAYAALMVDIDKAKKTKYQRETASGRRVGR